MAINELRMDDFIKRLDPKGNFMLGHILENLNQMNMFSEDLLWKEANHFDSYQFTIRTKLPEVFEGELGAATKITKSEVNNAIEDTMILDHALRIDRRRLQHAGKHSMQLRMDEIRPFIESMSQGFVRKCWYGNPDTNRRDILGIANRYNSTTGSFARNIINNGGTTANKQMSAYYIVHGYDNFFCIHPEGVPAGVQHWTYDNDLKHGDDDIQDFHVDKFEWAFGIVPKAWRSVGRVCNIDRTIYNARGVGSALVARTAVGTAGYEEYVRNLLTNMLSLRTRVRKGTRRSGGMMGKGCWYMNEDVFEALSIVAKEAVGIGGGIKYDNYQGQDVFSFMGSPIKIVDQLTDSEAVVA